MRVVGTVKDSVKLLNVKTEYVHGVVYWTRERDKGEEERSNKHEEDGKHGGGGYLSWVLG